MRFQYIVSEVFLGLRRNLTMTIALVITVAIATALLGVGLLMRAQVETSRGYWYDKVEISVFMCNEYDRGAGCASGEVTEEQSETILQTLENNDEVAEVQYESQDEAYTRFQEQFRDTIADSLTADQLQQAYRVALVNPEEYEGVVSEVSGLPGVANVVDQEQLLGPFFRVLNGLRWLAVAVSVALVVSATLLIANTIRLSAYSRRRETGIMRLVGASNFFIQMPFVVEAAIAGVIGALLGSGVLALLQQFFIENVLVTNFQVTPWVEWSDMLAVVPWLVLTGVLLSSIASFVTLRRYLRV
ncbi:MAG TPA: permease-like cell division protein FtsX [Jiangellaceae bacterium]|nr:permease-like cell division protein FtsX [Jiangellaceae bacterium]